VTSSLSQSGQRQADYGVDLMVGIALEAPHIYGPRHIVTPILGVLVCSFQLPPGVLSL
jgi:hypothetical protein